jgi:hypothetical protein
VRAALIFGAELLVHYYKTLRHRISQVQLQLMAQFFNKFPDFLERDISVLISQQSLAEPNHDSVWTGDKLALFS